MSIPDYRPEQWQAVADLIADAGLKPPAPARTPHATGLNCWCRPMVVSISHHPSGVWHVGTAHTYGKRRGDVLRFDATAAVA